MFARVTIAQGAPERLDDTLRTIREQVLPMFQGQAGFQHLHVLIDRQNGRGLSVSLWESREALAQAEAAVNQMRGQVAQTIGMAPLATEVYEVAIEV
jgi:heme-degrading monooxygenase HmoA